MDTPLRFTPFLRPMVWGGRRLSEVLGKPLPSAESYGESWEVSDHALHQSRVASGSQEGRTLRQLLETDASALVGQATSKPFPWLVKFLDACDWLSVQVHPDERAVGRLWPGEGSKTEAWFVIDAAPGSRIYAGLAPGTDERRLRDYLALGTVADCLHSFGPRPGDCVFLPAGTVHAVGGGVLLAEIQQTSDATFRLFDWNRRDVQGKTRTLHIEEALACVDWSRGPVRPLPAADFGAPMTRGTIRQPLVECPYFQLEYVSTDEPFSCSGDGRLRLLVALRGRGCWEREGRAGDVVTAGQAWLLPAALPRWACRPAGPLAGLVCTLP